VGDQINARRMPGNPLAMRHSRSARPGAPFRSVVGTASRRERHDVAIVVQSLGEQIFLVRVTPECRDTRPARWLVR
jgi:hypothetical protein